MISLIPLDVIELQYIGVTLPTINAWVASQVLFKEFLVTNPGRLVIGGSPSLVQVLVSQVMPLGGGSLIFLEAVRH